MAAILPGLSGDTLQAQATNPSEPHSDAGLSPKALVFDTFGTVVDWRGSIIAEGTAWARARGITVDWARFADQWRNGYAPSLEKVRRGELSWTKLDVLHRMLLEDLERDIEKTIPDKNAPIVLYCGGGFRSALGRRASAHRA